ncbi:MAG: TlpA family protein disulfide reductase [Luteolibacter sp.]
MRCALVISPLCGLLVLTDPAAAEPLDPARAVMEMLETGKRNALDRLLTERGTEEEFQQAVDDARAANVHPQAILEARFLYRVDQGDDAALIDLLPDFNQIDSFNAAESAIFATVDDWRAAIEYLKALDALQAGDRAQFKKHITEAFWLSPHQASAYAPHIERLRTADAMRDLVMDLEQPLVPLIDVQPLTLAALLRAQNAKAIVLHFWSPWSNECEQFMPEFNAIAATLSGHGIATASLLAGEFPDLVDEARQALDLQASIPGSWLVDPVANGYARQLRVRDLPTLVILSPTGKVLFNGPPDDASLWKCLQQIDPDIHRPEAGGERKAGDR